MKKTEEFFEQEASRDDPSQRRRCDALAGSDVEVRAQTVEFPTTHPSFQTAQRLTAEIIAAAFEDQIDQGQGLLESIYEGCLLCEWELRHLAAESQQTAVVVYKGFRGETPLRFDIRVEKRVLVEVNAVDRLLPIHPTQRLRYMKLLNVPVGLLINFNAPTIKTGVIRLELPGAIATQATG